MIYFLRHIKGIAYFLAILVLFQSCIAIYNKSSIAEASEFDNWRIKVITIKGEKHRFDWIDERDGNIVSIHNTERILIDKEKVKQVVISDPAPHVIPLDSVSIFYGKASFLLQDHRGRFESQEFIQFEDAGNLFKCYQMTSSDTSTVIIPLGQVDYIKVINKEASGGVNFLVWLAVLTGVSALALSNMQIGFGDWSQ